MADPNLEMPRVALATCRTLPEPDPDDAPLRAALAARGVSAVGLPWDDPAADVGGAALCVLRSTWNYQHHEHAFRAWIDAIAAATTLLNPAPVVRWNLHKRYLAELAERGLPVVASAFVDVGTSRDDAAAVLDATGWSDVVVKPAVSASSWCTRRFTAARDEAIAFLAELVAVRDALVQPYEPGFASPGERSVIWIDGDVTHVVVRTPRFADDGEGAARADAATAGELELLESTLAAIEQATGVETSDLLYVRLDVVPDVAGRLCVTEVELIEPSLFLTAAPAAVEALADAITSRARAAGRRASGR